MTNLRCAELPPGRHDQRLAHMAHVRSCLDHQPLHMADDYECLVGRMAPAPVKSDGRSSCLQEKGYMGAAAGYS